MTRCDTYLVVGVGLLKPFFKKGVTEDVSKRVTLILNNGVKFRVVPVSRMKTFFDKETGEIINVEFFKESKRSNYFKLVRALTGLHDLVNIKVASTSMLKYITGRVGIQFDKDKPIFVKCPKGEIVTSNCAGEEILNNFISVTLLENISIKEY